MSYDYDYEPWRWGEVFLPEVSAFTKTSQVEPSIIVPNQQAHTSRKNMALISPHADIPCAALGVRGLLDRLNTTHGTSHTLDTPSLSSLLEDCIANNYDFGTAYGRLRPILCTHNWSTIQDVLCRWEEEDREMRQKALDGNRIVNLPPRRVWDLCSNRPISHKWMDAKDRANVWTPINGYKWPVPIPKDANLNRIRIEMLALGVEYTWLDVLCLRQVGGSEEDMRLEEWKVDVPTIGAVYRGADVVYYFNGLGRPLNLKEDWESDRSWFRRAWILQEFCQERTIAGDTPDGPLHAECKDRKYETELLTRFCKQLESTHGNEVIEDMRNQVSTNLVDKFAGLIFVMGSKMIPAYYESESLEDAWTALVNSMNAERRGPLYLSRTWRPSWDQVMTEALPANAYLPPNRQLNYEFSWHDLAPTTALARQAPITSPHPNSNPPRQPSPPHAPRQVPPPQQLGIFQLSENLNAPRAHAAFASSPPTLNQLGKMTPARISALPIDALKAVLLSNHINVGMSFEKSDLVSKVIALVENELADGQEEQERIRQKGMMEERTRPAEAQRNSEADGMTPVSSSPPTAPPKASSILAEQSVLCVVCQDEEANIKIGCGHTMSTTRECSLCDTKAILVDVSAQKCISPIAKLNVMDLTTNVTRIGELPEFHGGYGDIWKARLVTSSDKKIIVAVKTNYSNAQTAKRLYREIRIWQKLDHPNVLPLFGICHNFASRPSDKHVDPMVATGIVCPWMINGTLMDYLNLCQTKAESIEKVRLRLLVEVCFGLTYLHSKNIVHDDLHGGNVLIDDDGHARLADFGLSTVVAEFRGTSTRRAGAPSHPYGALRWAAPELVFPEEEAEPQLLPSADIYSAGGLILQASTSGKGALPF
ncbi:uncharacterized protein EV420DRAFT_1646775 [Desarmillaria tabescens]|uniref:Protein kinase domain-containing protein n=1 Tax=Armillaria tabescens TaxID=1929756 RepID=A0AA39MXK3_ARMTA|nr:uncharacterized protein EV420DRAFT_1646775 [Desarmillaria tabescens]KAK0449779.1 hypothetical protein EV420DRAFT_1646775 [Desarmillaria tabescens]